MHGEKICPYFVRKDADWFDHECKDSKQSCNRALRKYRKNRSQELLQVYLDTKTHYSQLKKQKKREFRRNQAEKLKNNINNSSTFWKELKKLGGNKRNATSDMLKLEDWYEHFKTVFKQADNNDQESVPDNNLNANIDSELNADISGDEVKRAVQSLKKGKSGGTDGIVPEMLKLGGEEVITFLTKLFNKVFSSGVYPEEWSKAIVIPIFKKGDVNLPDNYRGISLINIACKCYTSILNKRLYSWMEQNNKIVENQAGFRKMYSTTDQIFNLYAVIQKCLNRDGQKVYVAFVDFKKAFDSVNHTRLFEVIHKGGIRGRFFGAIQSMYQSLISCVRANNELSDFFDCPVGVRQGCVMSPSLFSLFINEIANHINECGLHGVQLLPNLLELFILLFADDVALISTSPRGLQAQLDSLNVCCNRLKLNVNKDKTKIMVFRKGGFLGRWEKWFLDGNELEVVNKYCYLGYTFTTMLSFKLGTDHLVSKGKKAVYLLCRAFQNCKEMSCHTFFRIFDAKVQSILLYSSEIWGYQSIDSIERVHMLACKRYLGVPLKSPNKMVYGELGRYPLYINSSLKCLKYWFRLLQMEDTRLPKQAYIMMRMQDLDGKRNWASEIRELLSKIGFDDVWHNQNVNNVNAFLATCKQRLFDNFIEDWSLKVRSNERYRLYSQVTQRFGKPNYLDEIDIYCFRVALTQIRFGVLPINNNMNRYGLNPRASMCPFCENQEENEIHLLYSCTIYSDLRNRFLPNVHLNNVPLLMEGIDIEQSLLVAKFVFYAMKRRTRLIE